MSALELFGALMICSACFSIGLFASHSEKLTCDRLHALLRLVAYLKSSISVTRTPLGTVFAECKDVVLEESGFLSVLNDRNATVDYSVRWQKAIKLLMLPPEAEKAAASVGRGLGRVDLKTQTEQLVYLEGVLTDCLKEQKAALENKQKVYKSVSLLVGVVVSILLL